MKVTIFTNGGRRHSYLIKEIIDLGYEVYVIKEVQTIEKKKEKNEILDSYFSFVGKAEKEVFNNIEIVKNYKEFQIEYGKLNELKLEELKEYLESDYYIVFGSSYIKGELAEFLVENKCINLHMGVSPYYRGSACNFWAQYDKNYELIGGTIHMLSKGLDSGEIIDTIVLSSGEYDKFEVGMIGVKETIDQLVKLLIENKIKKLKPHKQKKELEIRYSRIKDFNENIAREFLEEYKNNSKIKINR